jgi:hypothetical protein
VSWGPGTPLAVRRDRVSLLPFLPGFGVSRAF